MNDKKYSLSTYEYDNLGQIFSDLFHKLISQSKFL